MHSLLHRLCLTRADVRAWVLYDWGNSGFMTTIIQIFQIYFAKVAAEGLAPNEASARFYTATAVGAALVAVTAPLLGAIADAAGLKKKMMALFLALGVSATAALFFVGPGDWLLGAVLFVAANVGFAGTLVFYDSLLPFVAGPDEIDRVSSAGYALGYLGGGVLMAINLLWISFPATFGFADAGSATRWSFVSAAAWWLAFALPLFRLVHEPAVVDAPRSPAAAVRAGLTRLWSTFHALRQRRDAFLMLLAFLVYNDGINTIIKVGATYGTEIGIPAAALTAAILMVQFVGFPFAFLFGMMAARTGPKPAIYLSLAVYFATALVGYYMTEAWHFFVLAFLIGTVQGGSQALSRSLFATLIPRERSSEYFGFYAVSEKFAGIAGPALFAAMVVLTGSSRNAILGLLAFFVIGAALLSQVDIERGRRLAEQPEGAPA